MKIEFQNVGFSYQKKAKKVLDDINLNLDKNEIVFVMGKTGSGKSTLISHINGLLFASEGNVLVYDESGKYYLNKNLKNINRIRKSIGMVFQNPENQLFESSVLSDVMFGPLNFKMSEEDAKEASLEALKEMGVDPSYFQRSPFDLSGGEKRKVAIAGILSYKPSVFVFDEPTSNLDYKSTIAFFEMARKLTKEGKVIIVSHNQNLAYEYADRVILIDEGKIIKDATYKEVFSDKELLERVSIETPFVERIKERLGISEDVRNIKELSSYLRGDTLWI